MSPQDRNGLALRDKQAGAPEPSGSEAERALKRSVLEQWSKKATPAYPYHPQPSQPRTDMERSKHERERTEMAVDMNKGVFTVLRITQLFNVYEVGN